MSMSALRVAKWWSDTRRQRTYASFSPCYVAYRSGTEDGSARHSKIGLRDQLLLAGRYNIDMQLDML